MNLGSSTWVSTNSLTFSVGLRASMQKICLDAVNTVDLDFRQVDEKTGVRSWASRWNHKRFVLKKTVDVLKFSVQFKFQFSLWMTLPNLRSDNSFWPFPRILMSFNFQISMFKIRFCLWLIDQTCELWKRAGPGEERGRCWWNFHATELGTKIKVGLTAYVRKNALRHCEDFEISWISSRLAKQKSSWDTVKQRLE